MKHARSRPAFLAALCLSSLAVGRGWAFQAEPSETPFRPVASPVRSAGTFFLQGSTLVPVVGLTGGNGLIYNNTCAPDFYLELGPGGWAGDVAVDSGRLPSPTSPTTQTSATGCATTYTISGLRIGYCTPNAGPISVALAFYDCYSPCSDATLLQPSHSLILSGLPGASSPGQAECWTAEILLDDAGAFDLAADCDGVYSGGGLDDFGWSFSILESGEHGLGGPLLAGRTNPGCVQNPAEICWYGEGTVFANPAAPAGTGLGQQHALEFHSGGAYAGCYTSWHCSTPDPHAGLYLTLYSPDCTPLPGDPYCGGDGSAAPCPCGNASSQPSQGCVNSTGSGLVLSATGTRSLSSDTLRVWAENQPTSSALLLFHGTQQVNNGMGSPFGDGLRCVGGTTSRLGVRFPWAGFVQPWGPGLAASATAGSSLHYQIWYRDVKGSPCSTGYNLSAALGIAWAP